MPDLIHLVLANGLLLVFAVTFAARVGAPLPASPMLVIVGALGAEGRMSLAAALAVSIVANVLGDGLWFLAGRRHGYRVLRLLCRISMSPDSCVRQSETFIQRWGGSSLIAAKFVPGVSVVAAPMAGALGMSSARFLSYETLAAAIWSVLYLGLGAIFSGQIQDVLHLLGRVGAVGAALLLALAALYVAARYWRRRAFMREVGMPRVTVGELRQWIDGGARPVVIDVRSDVARTLDTRHIPGALRLELASLARHAAGLPRDRDIVLYCDCPGDASAARGALMLIAAGFPRARPLAGGIEAWVDAGQPVDGHRAIGEPALTSP